MSRGNTTFDWLLALTPAGRLHAATAANDAQVDAGFIRVHERAGHTVQRLSYDASSERFRAGVAPARERYYQGHARPAVPEVVLPASGTAVQCPLGPGTVIAHLRWPDDHPTHAGQVRVLVRGRGFESAASPDQLQPQRPPTPPVPPVMPAVPLPARPAAHQPTLF